MTLVEQQLGHYRLVRLIGQGGMGEVYLAEDTRIPRQVAIKVVRNEHQPYPNTEVLQQAERLFQREMKAISQLDHPHILGFHDFGKEPRPNGSIIYMVMPYRSEGSLADWLVQRGSALLATQDVEYLIAQAASALQHAHDHDIIHQDVKPSNFLLRANADYPTCPDLFLVDFGIAHVMSVASTTTNSMRGTPAYMPPEQWSSNPVPATDQYALAIMSYQLLTGQLPFKGMAEQIMFQHLMVAPKPPSELNSGLPPAIDAVILRALAKKSDERFPTIKAFAVALRQALAYTDLRTQLMMSQDEALQGGNRTITLVDQNQITATIPANAQHGQVLYLPEQGIPYYSGGPRGPLLLTLAIDQHSSTEAVALVSDNLAKPDSTALDQQNSNLQRSERVTDVKPSKQRTVVLVALVLLLIVSGISATVFVNNKITVNNANISATAQVITNTHATSTALMQEKNVTATAQVKRAATVIAANPDPYQPVGKLAFVDPLSQTDQRLRNGFLNAGPCQYVQRAYQVSQSEIDTFYGCQERITYRNFAFEVKMKIRQGNCGGITVRDSDNGKQYLFSVCASGFYSFVKRASNARGDATVLRTHSASAIKQGIGQLNTIAIVANGDTFDLYVNRHKIDRISDSTYSEGLIGLIAYDQLYPTTVIYRNARLWVISQP
jgi:eukaryotic-like serine/threonine-protein kinase